MIRGIKKSWIMFDINNHKTNAGYGSNRYAFGPNIFQLSHRVVHKKIIMKNPMLPTWLVIQTAILSSTVGFGWALVSDFTISLRLALNSSRDKGFLVSMMRNS